MKEKPSKTGNILKKCIDKIDAYCYNRDRYLSVFGHLFDEMAKNTRRIHPKKCYDSEWGLTHQEVWLLKMWKVDGKNTDTISKRMRLTQCSVRQYKSRISKKVGMNEFERRSSADNSYGGDQFGGYELSTI